MLLLAVACASSPPVPPEAPYFDGVPAYPAARRLCVTSRAVTDGEVELALYATGDDPPTVEAWYREHHGEAELQPSGEALFVRGRDRQVLAISPVGSEQPTCEVAPAESDRTSLVVTRWRR
jgi:hypothetical protein